MHVGKTEIDSSDIPGPGNEDVLEAKMTVCNTVVVAVLERAPDLSRELLARRCRKWLWCAV